MTKLIGTKMLRKQAEAIYIACPEEVAKDISESLIKAAYEIDKLRAANVTVKTARKVMYDALVEPGMRHGYRSAIAMCIYDNRRKDGRLNKKECNDVAELLIEKIWS